MHELFPIIHVPINAPLASEPMGTKDKFWYQDSKFGRCLFKRPRPGTGEDWAEKAAAEIADLLGLPHARYELAEYGGVSGTASPSIVMEHQSLIHGNEILVNIVKGYEASATKRYGQSKHTLKNVLSVLNDDQIGLPMGWTPPHGVSTPTGLMIGYLMFDVLIGNTDRHHENWAIVLDSSVHLNTDPGGFISPATPGEWLLRMAPTFDHASSLGAHLVDSKRTSILAAENGFPMEGYVEKARSALYHTEDDSKAMMTIDAFAKAAHYDGAAAKAWVLQVATRSIKEFRVVFDRFPRTRISDVAADFAVALLDANRRRLVSLMESWS